MLLIDKIDDDNIRIRQDYIDVNVASIFFASVGDGGTINISPKSAGSYRSFSDSLENITINGENNSDITPEEAVQELNTFIGSFKSLSSGSGSGTGGVTEHNQLTGRDAEDCHPMEAITGLSDALDTFVTKNTNEFLGAGANDFVARVVMNGQLVDPAISIMSGGPLDPSNFVNNGTSLNLQDLSFSMHTGDIVTFHTNLGDWTTSPLRANADQFTLFTSDITINGVTYPNAVKFTDINGDGAIEIIQILAVDDLATMFVNVTAITGIDITNDGGGQSFIQKKTFDSPELPSSNDAIIIAEDITDGSLKTILKSELSGGGFPAPDYANPQYIIGGLNPGENPVTIPDDGFIMIEVVNNSDYISDIKLNINDGFSSNLTLPVSGYIATSPMYMVKKNDVISLSYYFEESSGDSFLQVSFFPTRQ